MFKNKNITKYSRYLVVGLALSLTQACAAGKRNMVKVPIPEGTKVTILVLDERGKILNMMDEKGTEAIECELCSGESHGESYGENHKDAHCKERLAKESAYFEKKGKFPDHRRPLCASLTGGRTTINNWTTFSHIGHHRNPDCRAVESRGTIRYLPRGCYH